MAYTRKKRQQLKRIRQFISRAEKRGYRFDTEFKNQLTEFSTQKLKNLTPKKLYEKSQAISEETGKVITGTERRKEERKEVAQKAQETRRRHKAEREQREYYDYAERDYSEYETSYEDTILTNIESLIRQYEDSDIAVRQYGSSLLQQLLDEEITNYGRKAVALACENAPAEAIRASQIVIYASDQSQKDMNIQELRNIITSGVIPSIEQSKQMGETMEAQESFEEDIEN